MIRYATCPLHNLAGSQAVTSASLVQQCLACWVRGTFLEFVKELPTKIRDLLHAHIVVLVAAALRRHKREAPKGKALRAPAKMIQQPYQRIKLLNLYRIILKKIYKNESKQRWVRLCHIQGSQANDGEVHLKRSKNKQVQVGRLPEIPSNYNPWSLDDS